MSNWKFNLNLKDVWDRPNEMTIQDLGKIISERLEKLAEKLPETYKEKALDIAADFKSVDEDAEEFDNYMSDLYDLGDTIIGDVNAWPPHKLIWIATF